MEIGWTLPPGGRTIGRRNGVADIDGGPVARWQDKEGPAFLEQLGLGPGDRVLDFGCGPGGYVRPLAQVVGDTGKVVAIDVNEALIAALRTEFAGSPDGGVVEVRQTDGGLALEGIDDRSLDAVLLFDVLQHVEDWDLLLGSVGRVLEEGGRLLINPSRLSHPGEVDIDRLLRRLDAHGFELERTVRGRVVHYESLRDEEILVLRFGVDGARTSRA